MLSKTWIICPPQTSTLQPHLPVPPWVAASLPTKHRILKLEGNHEAPIPQPHIQCQAHNVQTPQCWQYNITSLITHQNPSICLKWVFFLDPFPTSSGYPAFQTQSHKNMHVFPDERMSISNVCHKTIKSSKPNYYVTSSIMLFVILQS